MEDVVARKQQGNDLLNSLLKEDILPSDITRYNEAEKFCLQLVSEFLQSYEMAATHEAFQEECSRLGFVVPPTTKKERIKKDNLLKILEHFAAKDLAQFFHAWETLVPPPIQEKMEYKKLTFYLHVHFAVLPLRKQSDPSPVPVDKECGDTAAGECNSTEAVCEAATNHTQGGEEKKEHSQGMEVLRTFLETKGTEFSAEPEFLPYYALPFVSNASAHPSFQELFTESWVNHLKSDLQRFVVEHSWGPTVAPQLLQYGLETRAHKSRSQVLEACKNLKQLRRRYQKLHKDHHNLIGVAAELTGALESTVKGQTVDLKATLSNCSKIFPDLFTQSPGAELPQEVASEEAMHRSVTQSHEEHFDLDFRKIKQHLATGSVKTKLLLFQALRWRITRSSAEERDNVVGLYFRHDVLSLHQSPSSSCASELPLSAHFNPTNAATPHPLQQVAARLVNTLASLRCGRDYLCSAGCGLLRILVPCLRGDRGIKVDAITADMILATLQKLSLRHSQRVGMIEVGLVEWLIQRLNADVISMKAYTLEYSTALLMNLCLHQRAKERCVPLAKTVLKLLTGLLATDITQAIPYVNGALYSLLAHPQLNQEAKRMGLCAVLECYLKHSEGEMAKQLEYILKLHRGDCQPDQSATSDEENADDDAEEVDLLEEELDNDDPVRSLHGELCGDQLLYQQYRLVFPYHGVVHPSTSSTSQSAGDLLIRPTTPRVLSFGSLDGKCSGMTICSANRPTTPPELQCDDSREDEEQTDTCSKTCDTLVLESLDKDDEDDDEDDVEQSHCSTDCKLTDSQEATPDCSKVMPPSQPSATSEDGEDEYTKAFTSRPKIPRTPTFQNNGNVARRW